MLYAVSCKASEATANRVILRSHYGTKASAHHFRLFQHLHIHPTKPILNVLIRSVKILQRPIYITEAKKNNGKSTHNVPTTLLLHGPSTLTYSSKTIKFTNTDRT